MEAESRIAIESDADVVTARQRARALAVGLEMPGTDQTLLATATTPPTRRTPRATSCERTPTGSPRRCSSAATRPCGARAARRP